jgi:hypothetical protein
VRERERERERYFDPENVTISINKKKGFKANKINIKNTS